MALADRLKLYSALEEARKRPLIVYVTSGRPTPAGQVGQMDFNSVPELCDQLGTLPSKKVDGIDLLVVSDGGDPMVALRAVTLIREHTDHLAIMIPSGAYSAATLLALGANEILMHPNGNLGPVDPQISARSSDGDSKNFGFEDMAGFLEFVREEVKLTDQQHVRAMFEMFCKEVGTIPVGVAAQSALLSLSLGEKLLSSHMTKETDIPRVKTIAKALSKGFYYHGYPVGRKEARDLNLLVGDLNPEIEDLMWKIWLDIEHELEIRKPFTPLLQLMASKEAHKLLSPVIQLDIPTGTPPDVVQGIYEDLAKNAVKMIEPVDYEIITALMESVRHASREVSRGKILAYRNPDLDLQMNTIRTHSAWESVKIQAAN